MPATSTAFGFAALSSQLDADNDVAFTVAEDGYIQALPDGLFASVDGRPSDVAAGKWLMDEAAFTALQANTPHQSGDLVIDYEHQTLNKEKNGQPAPAAGWFSIDDLQYRQGEGLFIKPRFTDNAIAYLSAKEYKYFSLVFGYDTNTGRPQFIHSAALTNRPGVDGMLPLATLSAQLEASQFFGSGSGLLAKHTQSNTAHANRIENQPEELHVNPLLKKLLAGLGIEVASDTDALTAEQETAALSALDELSTAAASVDGLNQRLAALSANSNTDTNTNANGQVNLSEYVPVATVNALRDQLAQLSAQNGLLTIDQAVKDAVDEGRVLACEQDYLLALGKQQGMAALSAHLDGRKPINALTTTQTATVAKPDMQDNLAALSADEKNLADAWGMSHADYAKAKAADKEQN
ncbi:phage protease [Shewanella fidelis]|uniref:Phage protease n=1 Tax=Shewanella fidelis TaxID=173509 RepID=A0AAW8NNF8_9GAMM|nr:phage protease [Shewanella fidelis]MDR8523473.1 phage protease [Shewanella fidelis]MDW4813294.1 phage protease [Shewanella fidelis]MDW4817334.1 phage protease [Shewanella fidelis]MDW4821310.1 phage protease [Shewanella fidelis]MDW4824612.1 phage protease [Shewanella fidelis]